MLDCICLKWIRLCHYFWSVCEIKTCCLFPPPNHESPPPPTHPSRTKISPKIVLGDSYQHLHSRESEKGEIPPPHIQHTCAWSSERMCLCVPSVTSHQIRIRQGPFRCCGAALMYSLLSLRMQLLWCFANDGGTWKCTGLGNLMRGKGLGYWKVWLFLALDISAPSFYVLCEKSPVNRTSVSAVLTPMCTSGIFGGRAAHCHPGCWKCR